MKEYFKLFKCINEKIISIGNNQISINFDLEKRKKIIKERVKILLDSNPGLSYDEYKKIIFKWNY